MQCKHCGSPLSIEDAYCPFCGQENEAVKQHTAEMQHFSKEFNRTKTAVVDETKRIKTYIPIIVLIVILAVANIAAIFVKENAYRFQSDNEKKAVNRQAAEYKKTLSEYESNGQYVELAALYNSRNLYYAEDLKEFYLVANAGGEYGDFLHALENIIGRRSRDYLVDDFESDDWKKVGQSLRDFWDYAHSNSTYYIDLGAANGTHKTALEDMENRITGILMGVCDFTEEEIAVLQKTDAQKISTEIRSRMEAK